MRKSPEPKTVQPGDTLAGNNPRNETAACPTGLDTEQAPLPQVESGSAPTSGAVNPPMTMKDRPPSRITEAC
jgi:hypothetical protein